MDDIKESMSQMTQIFHQKLAEFEERQLQMTSPSTPDTSSLTADFSHFKSFTMSALRTLQPQVDLLARSYDSLEMHSRRKILLFHGIPEVKQEDAAVSILKVVADRLNLPEFKVESISHCYRMGRTLLSDRPRPILLKIKDASMRSKIWAVKTKLKGSGITMSEFLTKLRHDTFIAARQRYGVTKSWTRHGFIFVLGADGARHRVSCLAELDKLGLPSVAGTAPKPKKPAPTVDKEPPATVRPRRPAVVKK